MGVGFYFSLFFFQFYFLMGDRSGAVLFVCCHYFDGSVVNFGCIESFPVDFFEVESMELYVGHPENIFRLTVKFGLFWHKMIYASINGKKKFMPHRQSMSFILVAWIVVILLVGDEHCRRSSLVFKSQSTFC